MKIVLTYLGLVTTLAFAAAATSGSATAGNTATEVCTSTEVCTAEAASRCPLPCPPGPCATACEMGTVATNQ